MFELRYYQQEAQDSVVREWERHQATTVIACTGSGKTELYLSIAVSVPGRVLVIAHRDYLLEQPIARLAKVGFTDVAVEKAEQKSETAWNKAKVVFASVQSLCREKRLATFDPAEFTTVIIDEGHRAVSPTYRKIVDHFRRNARVRFLILTATPKRKDNLALGNLCDGDISVAYTYPPKQAADDGWIVPLRFFRREVKGLDFSRVQLKGTDLDQDQVESIMIEEGPLHKVCASLAEDRGPTIVFCPGVKLAQAYASLMSKRYRPGRATALWADSPDEEREEAGKRLAHGDLDYIFNVDLFTEGFDVPELARVVWAAPTASLVRFTQGTGRVFRPHASLRGRLTGDRDEAPQRLLLIQQSPKPFGDVVTYYPQNCKHQLCEPIDILGGDELPPDVRQTAKMVQEITAAQPRGSEPEEDVETARCIISLRELLEKRRQKIKAQAETTDVAYDAFGGTRNRATESSTTVARKAAGKDSWPDGVEATPGQLWWLSNRGGIPNVTELGLTKWRAYTVGKLIDAGVAPETALAYGKRQAMAVLDSIQKKAANA